VHYLRLLTNQIGCWGLRGGTQALGFVGMNQI